MSTRTGAPFEQSCALDKTALQNPHSANGQYAPSEKDAITLKHLLGNPVIGLSLEDVYGHLSKELATPLLDELYERLWLVARKTGSHIDTLHMQKVKGRSIIPTEDPKLHLVWKKGTIYIKPVPQFLLNHDFWVHYLQPPGQISSPTIPPLIHKSIDSGFDRSIAMGFLRSYAYLVKYPLDFAMAKEHYLVPADITWIQWSTFINNFRLLGNRDVANRYHYGQLRLSRLNWAVRIFGPQHTPTRLFYENNYWSVGEFMERATIPLLFLFASISIALSAMQVALAVPLEGLWPQISSNNGLKAMDRAFWLFSIAMVFLWLFTWFFILGVPFLMLLFQLLFACTTSRRK
ncbi:unnamed protein product [Penicillium salamii]|uniref:Uncharacterized protein n=1 Tax=Penicillium salamii TaxID=1612424 RepID=A0A9W4NCJ9_9EURO|nr:unnamed protein product [Penicillium salamii]CAG8013789.1 unnamed protein product [Penicillium salamii]CAG8231597.1 unnamed protein product [Penicillium salamii]CAG8361789.1 unnamed protein product [Penicillium salamii]CAG8365898.1 unnamed protein product [Penicillium salamii]